MSAPFTLVEPSTELQMKERYSMCVCVCVCVQCMFQVVIYFRKELLGRQLAEFITLYNQVST